MYAYTMMPLYCGSSGRNGYGMINCRTELLDSRAVKYQNTCQVLKSDNLRNVYCCYNWNQPTVWVKINSLQCIPPICTMSKKIPPNIKPSTEMLTCRQAFKIDDIKKEAEFARLFEVCKKGFVHIILFHSHSNTIRLIGQPLQFSSQWGLLWTRFYTRHLK